MRRALVLGGGGARGAYQAGMLLELVDTQGLDFHVLRGVSVGALNAAFLAQAPVGRNASESLANLRAQVHALHDLWAQEITGNHSVYAARPGGFMAVAAGADSLYTVAPLRHLIAEHLSLDALRASGRDFAVGTVSLVSGRYQEWTPADDDFVEKLIASAAIPVVFPYVDTGNDVLVDGGVRNITPLSAAFRAHPDELTVLLTSRVIAEADGSLPDSAVVAESHRQWDDNWLGTKVGGLAVLKRVLDILTDEIYLDDIRGAVRWNRVAREVDRLVAGVPAADRPTAAERAAAAVLAAMEGVAKRYVPLAVLAPREWYGTDNSATDFSPTFIRAAIAHGRAVAADPSLWLVRGAGRAGGSASRRRPARTRSGTPRGRAGGG
ncbi:MAG: patatin-like phospholipase family protein [Acidobacteriota bacterium]